MIIGSNLLPLPVVLLVVYLTRSAMYVCAECMDEYGYPLVAAVFKLLGDYIRPLKAALNRFAERLQQLQILDNARAIALAALFYLPIPLLEVPAQPQLTSSLEEFGFFASASQWVSVARNVVLTSAPPHLVGAQAAIG